VLVPLVDVGGSSGATAFLQGSHIAGSQQVEAKAGTLATAAAGSAVIHDGRVLHSFTFQLNVSAFVYQWDRGCVLGVFRGCLGGVRGI
jgi:hypothetical protein